MRSASFVLAFRSILIQVHHHLLHEVSTVYREFATRLKILLSWFDRDNGKQPRRSMTDGGVYEASGPLMSGLCHLVPCARCVPSIAFSSLGYVGMARSHGGMVMS